MKLLFVAISILIFSCSKGMHKVDPEALKLNDDAVAIISGTKDSLQLEQAVMLLNKAIKIDSNYLYAYSNKAGVLTTLKHYKPALLAIEKFCNMIQNKNSLEYILGTAYEKAGDTASARKHYKFALIYFKKVLDTMNLRNTQHEFAVESLAQTLILLHRKPEADSILTTTTKGINSFDKSTRAILINESRNDVLYPECNKGVIISADDLKKINFRD